MEGTLIRMKASPLLLALAVAGGMSLLAGGCASATKGAPQQPAQAAAPAADRIEYLEVSPWVVSPGGQAVIEVGATKKRTLTVVFTGLDGASAGKTRTVNLAAKTPGVYTGVVLADAGMPPGKYRIETTLTGGPGDPAKLVSSRALTVAAPAPAR